MRNKQITKEIMRKQIDEMTKQFALHLKNGSNDDPAVFHYYRLLSLGLDRDDAMKMITCVAAMFQLGKMAGEQSSSDVISKMYELLPESDAEKYLYDLCK